MLRWMAGLGFAFLFGTFPLAATQPASEPQTCALRIQITDEDGGEIGKAFVLIHSQSGSNSNQQLNPSRKGEVKTSLRPGLYDLFVASAGFMPIAEIVDLRSCKPQSLNLMMTVDSEHIESGKF